MKLAKALKVKNRLVGELNQLKVELQRENSRRSDNPSKIDCKSLYDAIIIKRDSLISLKSAISLSFSYLKVTTICQLPNGNLLQK